MSFCNCCSKITERRRDGRCAPCARKHQAEYRSRNTEKLKADLAKWRAANSEKTRATSAAWRQANPEQVLANGVSWRVANPQASRAATKAWKLANPQKARIYEHNRRAKKAGAGKLSSGLAEVLHKKQRGKCAACRTRLADTGHHLDHIQPLALSGANEDWNIQLLCPACNGRKRSTPPHEFMQRQGYLL